MPIERLCKICGTRIKVYNTIQNKCRDCTLKNAKPIRQVGKETKLYNTWRDTVAIPYLTERYGYKCDHCKRSDVHLDVAHKKTRGARHDLKFNVMNVRFLCRDCHRKETDGKL